ncbi:MAG: tetraacyldisaccharide 4'-kinase [Elusimicrobia bacterium RIFOXYA2_FULL_39_19]|nr:MAG: tetraacyldisaccharide 4'-kinase [Elusimicrobia bacterium RIFOXYA2_FULL_39_19]
MVILIKVIFSPVLWLLSVIYGIAVKLKYNSSLKNKKYLPKKVICAGNITTGGTGKSPAVILLAKMFQEKGRNVAVLSRGYKRKSAGPDLLVVSDKEKLLAQITESGDEPYLLAESLKGVPVIVCKSRYEAGKYAVENFNADLLILDDGFSHWKLHRDLDIVLIDCLKPFGGGFLLPLGRLREPLSCLCRASVILLTNSGLVHKEKIDYITNKIRKYNQFSPIVRAYHKPAGFEKIISREKTAPNGFENKKAIALSSIGNPLSFEKTLQSLGIDIVDTIRFPDHYWYKESDITKLSEKKEVIFTTQKDAVKIEAVMRKMNLTDLNMHFLKIELEIEEKKTFENFVFKV